MANYTLHHMVVGSDTYEMVDEQGRANIAPSFSTSTTYAAGDYVIYSGKLYQFTAAHTGAWTGSDAKATTVSKDTSQLKEDISHIGGLSEVIKQAMLQIAMKVAYVDEHGQDYYDDLYNALYEEYTVTNNLTDVTNSNSATTATGGSSYTATLTANSGVITTLLITMGGRDITSQVWTPAT